MINLLEAFKNEDSFTKKKFGHHFLTNKAILDKIIEAANFTENDNVIEIGPGCGFLTQLITESKKKEECVLNKIGTLYRISFLNRIFNLKTNVCST